MVILVDIRQLLDEIGFLGVVQISLFCMIITWYQYLLSVGDHRPTCLICQLETAQSHSKKLVLCWICPLTVNLWLVLVVMIELNYAKICWELLQLVPIWERVGWNWKDLNNILTTSTTMYIVNCSWSDSPMRWIYICFEDSCLLSILGYMYHFMLINWSF